MEFIIIIILLRNDYRIFVTISKIFRAINITNIHTRIHTVHANLLKYIRAHRHTHTKTYKDKQKESE